MTTKFLQRVLPKNVYSKMKEMLVYRPNDPINLLQQTPQFKTNATVERIKGYRFPAPGSTHIASSPMRDDEDSVYDTMHYPRSPENITPNVRITLILLYILLPLLLCFSEEVEIGLIHLNDLHLS